MILSFLEIDKIIVWFKSCLEKRKKKTVGTTWGRVNNDSTISLCFTPYEHCNPVVMQGCREKSVGRGTQQAVYFAPGQQLNSDEKLSERDSKQQSSCLATCHIKNIIYHFLLRIDWFQISVHNYNVKIQVCY